MKFLVDAQLPPGLCVGLASRGHDAVHVADVLAGETPDAQVAAHALREGRVLITKDDDFARNHGDSLVIVWLRIGNASNRALAEWLEERWLGIEAALADGETLIEVR
jgi:predicted nuclease of predicted toxin-antitoxin system